MTLDTAALAAEIENSVHLAESGLKLLSIMKEPSIDGAGVFSCLAFGLEKFLKLSWGLRRIHEGSEWPSKDALRKKSHDLVGLENTAGESIRRSSKLGQLPTTTKEWKAKVDSNKYTPELIAILADYGQGGRFHDLDTLAGAPRKELSPAARYLALETQIINDSGYNVGEHEIEFLMAYAAEVIDQTFRDLWTLYTSAWTCGVFGITGKELGLYTQVSSFKRPEVKHLTAHIFDRVNK